MYIYIVIQKSLSKRFDRLDITLGMRMIVQGLKHWNNEG
jgi:hypothetical protein